MGGVLHAGDGTGVKVNFLCNALDSSAALYNIFEHLAKRFACEANVLHRDSARSPQADVLVYDSAYCAAYVHGRLTHPQHYKHVVLHHIHESPQQEVNKRRYLELVMPDLVIVTFDAMRQAVEEWGFDAVTIPFSFDTTRFHHLPYPQDFTIGYMGADMAHKGFDVVDEAARELGIKCVGARRPSHEDGPFARRELDFYRQISCYVAAPLHESGPLPPIEAQLCGRPCVVTPVGMMPYMFEHGGGGELVAGAEEVKEAVQRVQEGFEAHAAKARAFKLPDTAHMYEQAILGVM